ILLKETVLSSTHPTWLIPHLAASKRTKERKVTPIVVNRWTVVLHNPNSTTVVTQLLVTSKAPSDDTYPVKLAVSVSHQQLNYSARSTLPGANGDNNIALYADRNVCWRHSQKTAMGGKELANEVVLTSYSSMKAALASGEYEGIDLVLVEDDTIDLLLVEDEGHKHLGDAVRVAVGRRSPVLQYFSTAIDPHVHSLGERARDVERHVPSPGDRLILDTSPVDLTMDDIMTSLLELSTSKTTQREDVPLSHAPL
ncbi:hypothetical protein LSAT2_019246, partial [Lamellibrachia satsuma]